MYFTLTICIVQTECITHKSHEITEELRRQEITRWKPTVDASETQNFSRICGRNIYTHD